MKSYDIEALAVWCAWGDNISERPLIFIKHLVDSYSDDVFNSNFLVLANVALKHFEINSDIDLGGEKIESRNDAIDFLECLECYSQ